MASQYPPSTQYDEAASPSNIHINNPPSPQSSKGVVAGQDVTVTISDYDVARIANAVRVLMQADITELHERIHTLEAKLEFYEQNDKYNNICITGLPEKTEQSDKGDDNDDETVETAVKPVVKPLHEQVEDIATAIGVDLTKRDVDKIYRTGKPMPGRNRPVIVKLTNNYAKRQLLTNSLKLRKSKDHRGVYLNDDLTYANRQIAAAARKHVKEGKLMKTWSTNGAIYVLDNVERKVRIKCTADLDVAIVKAFRESKLRKHPARPSATKTYSSALSASAPIVSDPSALAASDPIVSDSMTKATDLEMTDTNVQE